MGSNLCQYEFRNGGMCKRIRSHSIHHNKADSLYHEFVVAVAPTDMFGNDLTKADSFGTPHSDTAAELQGAEEFRRQLVKAMEAIQANYPLAYKALRQQWLQVDNRIQYLKSLAEADHA